LLLLLLLLIIMVRNDNNILSLAHRRIESNSAHAKSGKEVRDIAAVFP
jgi:hypothetical protein